VVAVTAPVFSWRALTVAATADRLSLSERTVRRLILCGELPRSAWVHSVRVPEAALDELLAAAARSAA